MSGGFFQRRDLRARQIAPVPKLEAAVAERPDGDALQVIDGVADRIEHLPDLAVPSLANRDAKSRLALPAAGEHLHVGGSGSPAVDRHAA